MSTRDLQKGIKDDLSSMFLLMLAGAGAYVVYMFVKGGHDAHKPTG